MKSFYQSDPIVIGILFEHVPQSLRGDLVRWWVEKILANTNVDTTDPDFTLLTITLPCGGQATYRTVDDIPLVDVPCPCGDPNHWLIKYTK